MIIEFLVLIIVVVIGIILYPRIRRWLKIGEDKSKGIAANYQCQLYEEQDKRDACERLMNKGKNDN